MSAAHENPTGRKRRRQVWHTLPAQGTAIVAVALLLSVAIHLLSSKGLSGLSHPRPTRDIKLSQNQVKVRIVQTPKAPEKPKKAEPEAPTPEHLPRILETPQTKTERPKESTYVGNVDHTAQKETRISEKAKREKAADAGNKGRPDVTVAAPVQAPKPPQPKPQQAPLTEPKPQVRTNIGSVAVDAHRPKPRNQYEALLPSSMNDLPGQLTAGYQDYVDDKVEEGDRIDINTTEYRFIGYFTAMRKAIELVWNYPLEASRRGMQGEVNLEFAIARNGQASRIRVLKSSGYEALDQAIVDAIKLASPFSPLPNGFAKERLIVTGSFRYILSSYGSH